MRAVSYSDVLTLAQGLRAVPEAARVALCRRVFFEAITADRYVRRLRKLHPHWGNGTLSAAASRRERAAVAVFDDADFCQCFEIILAQLRKRPRVAAAYLPD